MRSLVLNLCAQIKRHGVILNLLYTYNLKVFMPKRDLIDIMNKTDEDLNNGQAAYLLHTRRYLFVSQYCIVKQVIPWASEAFEKGG